MTSSPRKTVRDLLLTRRGVLAVSPTSGGVSEELLRALELELAAVGYLLSYRLRARLAASSEAALVELRAWALPALVAHVGGAQKHEPLFRRFPEGIPSDTAALWWTKVLVLFLQAEGQPCLFCKGSGTTHVLRPCAHVICDRCFDGANYSACPACERQVDRSSPFFREVPVRGAPVEQVTFKLLDLTEDETAEARALFATLCERKQALSPADRAALVILLQERGAEALAWLPAVIPVRENIAVVFGTLFSACDPAVVLPHASRFLTTATDVLRFIAVRSGTDGSLLRETVYRSVEVQVKPTLTRRVARRLGIVSAPATKTVNQAVQISRFKTAKLPRPLRRALLGLLEGMPADRLVEDMLRHRSYWVWVGEFLHPHEYAARFPAVARAFQILRKKSPDGTPAPPFSGWRTRLERSFQSKDAEAALALLRERPGELARAFDRVLRATTDAAARDRVLETFVDQAPSFATPVLVTLRSHLTTRAERAAIRVYWPKGRVAKGVSAPDERATLPRKALERAARAIDAELLRRFATKPAFDVGLVDEQLRTIITPFNERTASDAAVALPRGSRVAVPAGKLVRLFLHWCEPEKRGDSTDLDLSVGLYDASWKYVGVCSYYQLQAHGAGGALIAQSSGDRQDGPWPDGATEFVDLHREPALAAGVRYAVMVVNNYAGMPFGLLERAFAGVMLRDDAGGAHFDPRTVELKFMLSGDNGIFLPLVLDLREGALHWLDVHSKGKLAMNNVATSSAAITKICPELMTYFGSGARTSMFDLGLLHAAARCPRVLLRGSRLALFERRPDETVEAFHARLLRNEADAAEAPPPAADSPPLLALLYRGDLDLPEGSRAYALFRDRVTPSLAASDLLS